MYYVWSTLGGLLGGALGTTICIVIKVQLDKRRERNGR